MKSEIVQERIMVTDAPNELLLVPAIINGSRTYNFIVDTGASCCCLSEEAAKELNIKDCKKVAASGANGNLSAHQGILDSISIGKAHQKNLEVAIFDFSSLRKADKSIGGIIGHNFLCHYIVTINYRENILVLEN